MECRPFKDPNFELIRLEKEIGIQAIPETTESGSQATKNRMVNAFMQYQPFMAENVRKNQKEKFQSTGKDEEIAAFLDRVRPLYEKALQQNELYDIFEDKFGLLAEEDHGPGNKNENNIWSYCVLKTGSDSPECVQYWYKSDTEVGNRHIVGFGR